MIDQMIFKSKQAQQIFETSSQDELDRIVKAIAKVIFDHAEELARDAVDEAGIGKYEDKVAKNRGKAMLIWNYLKDKKSTGIIEDKNSDGIIKVAKPMGVIGSITPVTNPTVTPLCNVMFALKGGNSIIVAPHPNSKNTSAKTIELMMGEVSKLGGPEHLIQCITEPSLQLTNQLMQKVDVVVATGGPGMVTSAYSSGKPALGVGAGNVQAIITENTNFDTAAEKVITGRKFDNGIICSGENAVLVPKEHYDEIIAAFQAHGAYYISDQDQVDKFRHTLFRDGHLVKDLVGQNIQKVAEYAGITVSDTTQIVLLKSSGAPDDVLRKEILCPVLTLFEYDTFEDALNIANQNLDIIGKGHTCSILSDNQAQVEQASAALPVSRIAVNAIASQSVGGNFQTGFVPTTGLGCGSWGNNSISDNLNYKHFINIQRVGYMLPERPIPSPAEIWD